MAKLPLNRLKNISREKPVASLSSERQMEMQAMAFLAQSMPPGTSVHLRCVIRSAIVIPGRDSHEVVDLFVTRPEKSIESIKMDVQPVAKTDGGNGGAADNPTE